MVQKLRLLILALMMMCASTALVSCEKSLIADENESGATKGNLQVSVFQIDKTPFGSFTATANSPARRVAASEACTRLNFAIYNQEGTRIKQVNQTSDMSDFGKASFQLAEGTYQLVVVGHSASGNPTMTDPAKVQFTNATGYTDTFLCYGEVTIGEEAASYQVSLDRIVSLCRFVITDDAYPADVKKMRFYYTGGSGAFDAATALGCVNSKQDVKFDVSATQKQFDLYTFLHATQGTIHLAVSALDASDNELYKREFDVPMQQNYITRLSGPFFEGSGSSTATTITGVTVNTDWAGETHYSF